MGLQYSIVLFLWSSLRTVHAVRPIANTPVFFSRPDLNVPVMNVTSLDEGLSNGSLFVTPSFHGNGADSGPYIFDTSGTLVWSGIDDCAGAGLTDIQGLHVCLYLNEEHLCFWQGRQRDIHGRGVGVVMDRHYQIVKTVKPQDSTMTIDLHEFHLTSNNTAIFTTYSPRLYNGIWILDSGFREINLDDGRELFTWNALDHVSPSESHVAQGSYLEVGNGRHPVHSWDYFHLNSVDKSDNGNYLISARHTDSVYAISSTNATILWQLGGENSTFVLGHFTYMRQHHARYISESATQTVISLFNNDDDGYTARGTESQGMVVVIDHQNNTARIVKRFSYPGLTGQVSPSMGNVEQLPGGNVLVNWGAQSKMAEYLVDGTPIWSADLGLLSRNYRAFKSEHWVGQPLQPPALYALYDFASESTYIYMSWNGATQVSSWRIYVSDFETGPYTLVGETPKHGFETTFHYGAYLVWVSVEAVGSQASLRNSTAIRTVSSSLTHDAGVERVDGTYSTAIPPRPVGAIHTTQIPGVYVNRCSSRTDIEWSLWHYLEHFLALIGTFSCLIFGYNLPRQTVWGS